MHAPDTWYVLMNPHAGKGEAVSKWERVADLLKGKGFVFEELSFLETQPIESQVIEAIGKGGRKFILVGGDGTHHYVVNGLLGQTYCPSTDITYALLPAGTGNDWRRHYGIPTQAAAWARMFLAQHTFVQDAGEIEAVDEQGEPVKRYFSNVAGLGYDAHVVRHLQASGITAGGGWKYFRAIFSCLREYVPSSLKVETEENTFEDAFYSMNVGITRFSGGGMQFVPHAHAADGKLAFTLIDPVPAWRVVINTPWLYSPFFDRHPMAYAGQTSTISFSHKEKPSWVEADGELIGQTPARIHTLPKVLKFLVPQDFKG